MKSFFDAILDRCIAETDMDMRLSLAKCLGEIGAIHPKYIGDDLTLQRACTLSNQWILENGAPWKSKSVKIHCQLQLVTKYFVAALKAAPTPTDQHLIGFAIQEGMILKGNCKKICIIFRLNSYNIFASFFSVENA